MTILEMCLEKLFDKNEEIVLLVYCPHGGGGGVLRYLARGYNFAIFSNSILNRLSFWMEVF